MKSVSKQLIIRVHNKIIRFGKALGHGRFFLAGLYAHRDELRIAVSDAYNYVRLGRSDRPKVECISVDSEEIFIRKVKSLDHRF